MIRNDFIMRLLEQVMRVLASILFKREMKEFEASNQDIEDAFKDLLNLDFGTAAMLNIDDLCRMLELKNSSSLYIAAKLIHEYANNLLLLKKSEDAQSYYLRALKLYVYYVMNYNEHSFESLKEDLKRCVEQVESKDAALERKIALSLEQLEE